MFLSVMASQLDEVYCKFPVEKSMVVPELDIAVDLMTPLTSSATAGAVVPIPTTPGASIFSCFAVLNSLEYR